MQARIVVLCRLPFETDQPLPDAFVRQPKFWIGTLHPLGFDVQYQPRHALRRVDVEQQITPPRLGRHPAPDSAKRQMNGRAGFELLKARVLPWDRS